MMKVSNFKGKANQFVLVDNETNTTTFQSYNSTICIIDRKNNVITFGVNYRYSQTTMKYLKQFLESQNLDGLAGIKNVDKAIIQGEFVNNMNNYKVEYANFCY